MRFPSTQHTQYTSLSLLFILLDCTAGSALAPRIIRYDANSTISSTSKTSSVDSSSQRSPTPTLTTASGVTTTVATGDLSTITSAPAWGNQTMPINTCTNTISQNGTQVWPCHVSAGTVQLTYWPTNGNLTYPSTYYVPELSITMTSPSVYMVVNTIYGYNSCGRLGPTFTNAVFSFDLTDVSTLQPYADATVTTRIGNPSQLQLSDLALSCPKTNTDTVAVNTMRHPLDNTFNRCNPSLVIPFAVKYIGYPYWHGCGNYWGGAFGLFDPPGAIPACNGNDCLFDTTVASAVPTSTYDPASTGPTAQPDEASSTSFPIVVSTPQPTTPEASSTAIATSFFAIPPLTESSSVTVADTPTPAQVTETPIITAPNVGSTSAGAPAAIITTPVIVATLGSTNVISIVLGATSVVDAGQTAYLSGTSIVIPGNGAVRLTPSSLVEGDGSDQSLTTYTFPANTVAAAAAVLGGQVVSAVGSAVVIGSQTISVGGSAVTVNSAVVSLGASGIVVQLPGGVQTVIPVPKASASVSSISTAAAAAVLGGQVVSAVGSAVVIGSQTISVGGSAVIVNSAVVSLGASGIVVQLPGGVQTVIPVPKASASVSSISTAAAVAASTASVGSTASGPASSSTTPPALVQVSAGSRINGIVACASGLMMLGLVYAL